MPKNRINKLRGGDFDSKLKILVITIYVVFCVLAAFYIKEVLAADYIEMLLDLTYSNRNQSICGSNPIERDTIRYTMYDTLKKRISRFSPTKTLDKYLNILAAPTDSVIVIIGIVIITAFAFILIYLFFAHKYKFLEYFDSPKMYVTNIAVIIIMGCCIGFWYNYKVSITQMSQSKIYSKHRKNILNKELLPDPPKIISTVHGANTSNLFGSAGTSNSIISGLYTNLVSRMMYVDNLISYEETINKWNSFTTNTDIYPYIIFTNDLTNNITPDTIIAQEYLTIWQKELDIKSDLANSVGPYTSNIIYNIDIHTEESVSSSSSSAQNILTINYVDASSGNIVYSDSDIPTLPENTGSNLQIIHTSLNHDCIRYINSNVLPYLNSLTNIENNTISHIPSSIKGITTYLEILVGTQNINNDYNILYKYAQQNINNKELLNSLYWISNIENGDPTNDIYNTMNTNAILYNIITVLISYIPFHIMYMSSSLALSVCGIIALFMFHVIVRMYFIYQYQQNEIDRNKNNKNYKNNTFIKTPIAGIIYIAIILSIILIIFYAVL